MSAATDLMRKLPLALDIEAAAAMECSIQLNLSAPMHLTIRDRACSVRPGEAPAPDVTLTMEDEDFVALMTGELNGMRAYLTGKLTVDGDLLLAQRLPGLFDARKLG